jgi:uncharacterized protein (DUF488 family)
MTTIYTIGHSNHEVDEFLALLLQHDIRMVVDVRSSPYSRYVPHANRETLARALQDASIGYRWMGDRLGGMPEGAVGDYDEMAASPAFQQGIEELIRLADEQRLTIMCSEGDHRRCHRHKLITPALLDREVQVYHVQPDGDVVDENAEPRQLSLF